MPFHFKRKESVIRGVRRMCHELHDEVADCLKGSRKGRNIHRIRKDIKKTRAILRLVKGSMRKKTFRRQIELLRRSAYELAAVRDARVAVKTVEALQNLFRSELPPTPFRHTMSALNRRLKRAADDFAKKKSPQRIKRYNDRFTSSLEDSRFRGKGWKAIGEGLQDSYYRAHLSHEAALKKPSPANLHEWRKRTKDVWYCLRLLRKSNPAKLGPLADGFNRIGDCLGDEHDLWALDIAHRHGQHNAAEVKILRRLIRRRRRELQKSAFELGRQLFAGEPAIFQKRLEEFWKTWRHE